MTAATKTDWKPKAFKWVGIPLLLVAFGFVVRYHINHESPPEASRDSRTPYKTTSMCSGSKAYLLNKGQEVEVNSGGACAYRYAVEEGGVQFLDPWRKLLFTVVYQGDIALSHRPNTRMSHIRGLKDGSKVVITLTDPS